MKKLIIIIILLCLTGTVYAEAYKNPTVSANQYVQSDDKNIVSLSKSIVKDCKTNYEKAEKIYTFVVNYMSYDFDKLKKYPDYTDKNGNLMYSALIAYKNKKGTCLDYSFLLAALCRASGLQTKVVYGYHRDKTSHSWNEIYIVDGDDAYWVNADATDGEVYYCMDIKKFGYNHKGRYFEM